MKISIDYDDTLSNPKVQRLARMFVLSGYDVHIVTSRMNNKRAGNPRWNDDLFIVADAIGIPEDNIHFCNLKPKFEFFKENKNFSFHLDDDSDDVDGINLHCDGIEAILFVDTYTDVVLGNLTNKIKALDEN